MREEIFQKINADNKSKQHVVLHWGSFALVSLAIFLCTIALPNTFTENGIDPCKEKLNLPHFNLTCHEAELSLTNERTLIVSDYNPLNMFIYIQGSITMNSKAKIDEVFQLHLQFTLFSAYHQHEARFKVEEQIYHTKNHTILVTCKKKEELYLNCDPFLVAFVSGLYDQYSSLLIQVHLTQEQTILSDINTFSISSHSVSKPFTISLIIIRSLFLILSILNGLIFVLKMRKLKLHQYSLEQKLLLYLSFLLIFFNDPFYCAYIFRPNYIIIIQDAIFISSFVSMLLFFWLILMEKISSEICQKHAGILFQFKVLLTVLFWISLIFAYSIISYDYRRDPSKAFQDIQSPEFQVFKIFGYTFAGFILTYYVVQYVRFTKDYHKKIWRYKILGVFSLFFQIALAIFIYTGNFKLYQFDGSRILLTWSILNMYVYYAQYLYIPSDQDKLPDEQNFEISDAIYDQIEEDQIIINSKE